MICEITAKFSCDDCGTEFFTTLDPAYEPPRGWCLLAIAENTACSGILGTYEDATGDDSNFSASMDGIRHLCARCTRKYDARENAKGVKSK